MSERSDRRTAIIAWLGAMIVRLLAFTWRVRWVNTDFRDDSRRTDGPAIYVLWHGELLPLLYAHRNRQIAALISEHRDGEIIARIAHSLGTRTVRGSTSRGAARALLAACREIEQGYDVAITPDGPRGPVHSVAPGSLVISQRTGAPMLPVVASASRAWHLKSWDSFMVPKPFARVTVAYGPTFGVRAASARDAASEAEGVRVALEDAARRLAEGNSCS